jgi:flagellar basal body rod protein FlgG
VDAEGVLRTGNGWKVQGLRGHIQLPKDAQTVSIDTMGKVLVDDRVVDELRMVALQPGVSVTPDGQGILRADPAAWVKDQGSMGLRSGHLESSNVVASQEMVHLMGITRHAESMVRVIQASDEMLEKAIRKLGDLA